MKLLSKKQINKIESGRNDKKIEKRIQINDEMNKELNSLNRVKLYVKNEKGKLLNYLSNFSLKINIKIKQLSGEVEKLEDRRLQALKPITDELTSLANEKSSMAELEISVQNKKEDLDSKTSENKDILDEIKEERKSNKTESKKLDKQKNLINDHLNILKRITEETRIRKKKFKKLFNDRSKTLKDREDKIKVNEGIVRTKTKINEIEYGRIKKKSIKLNSKEEALKSAFEEARRKGIKI